MEGVIQICNKYNINVSIDSKPCWGIGIGDLLFLILAIKNNIIELPVYFNVCGFITTSISIINPLNALEFRIQLLKTLMDINKLDFNSIKFIIPPSPEQSSIQHFFQFNKLTDLHLACNPYNHSIKKPYIVFHTKIRMSNSYDYVSLKQVINTFGQSFCTNYTIVIIGEREPPNTVESKIHNMQSCYTELIQLKNSNTVIDLTSVNFDLLDINAYMKDISLITNADINISFGGGGSACAAIVFGRAIIHFDKLFRMTGIVFDQTILENHSICIYEDYTNMIEYIWALYGNKSILLKS
jgi:hypothetical protein